MSIFTTTTKTSTKIKDVSLTLVLIGSLFGATLSTSANAAPVNGVENAVSDFVVAQGKSMISELNSQLQLSIEHEINALSANISLDNASMWLTPEQQVKEEKTSTIKTVESKISKQINSNANTNNIQTK